MRWIYNRASPRARLTVDGEIEDAVGAKPPNKTAGENIPAPVGGGGNAVISLPPINQNSRVLGAATMCREEPTQPVDARLFDPEFTSVCVDAVQRY